MHRATIIYHQRRQAGLCGHCGLVKCLKSVCPECYRGQNRGYRKRQYAIRQQQGEDVRQNGHAARAIRWAAMYRSW